MLTNLNKWVILGHEVGKTKKFVGLLPLAGYVENKNLFQRRLNT